MGGRMLDVKRATIDLKGSARLDEIRASLDAEKQQTAIGSAATAAPAVEAAPTGTSAGVRRG